MGPSPSAFLEGAGLGTSVHTLETTAPRHRETLTPRKCQVMGDLSSATNNRRTPMVTDTDKNGHCLNTADSVYDDRTSDTNKAA